MSNTNKQEVVDTSAKRSRGRPATFPGQETSPAAFNLPVETQDLLRKFAASKDRTGNSVVDSAIRRYVKDNS